MYLNFIFLPFFLCLIRTAPLPPQEVTQLSIGESYTFDRRSTELLFSFSHNEELSKNYIYLGVIPKNPEYKVQLEAMHSYPPENNANTMSSKFNFGNTFLLMPKSFLILNKKIYVKALCTVRCNFDLYLTMYDYLPLNVNNSPDSKLVANEHPIRFNKFLSSVHCLYMFISVSMENHFIIDLSYEDKGKFNVKYYFNKAKDETKSAIVYFSKKIILSAREVSEHCNGVQMCTITIDIDNLSESDIDLNIAVKSNAKLPFYLFSNQVKTDIIINNNIQYYYSNVDHNDIGDVVLTSKKGSGMLIGRIVNSSGKDNNPDWKNWIRLPKKNEQYADALVFDVNTNSLSFTEEETNRCTEKDNCVLIIGVMTNDEVNVDKKEGNVDSVYEYSIYYRSRNERKVYNRYGVINIPSHEYISGNLYHTSNYFVYFEYIIPNNINKIYYELQCDSCSLSLKYNTDANDIRNIFEYENSASNLPSDVSYDKLYNKKIDSLLFTPKTKILLIGISASQFDDVYFTSFLLKITPYYTNVRDNYIHINSEHHALCDSSVGDCLFYLPVSHYDLLSEVIVSISTIDDQPAGHTDFYAMVVDYNDTDYLIESKSEKKPKMTVITKIKGSTSNYMTISSDHFLFGDAACYISLTLHDKGIFNVFFTYEKRSHFTLLAPNKKNLLYCSASKGRQLNLPFVAVNDRLIDRKTTMMVLIKQLKGSARVIFKERAFDINGINNKMTIMYSAISRNEVVNMESSEGMYFYTDLMTKPYENMNKVSLFKVNYMIYKIDSFPIMIYMKLNQYDSERDIIMNFSIEGLDSIAKGNVKWSMKGFLLNDDFIERRKKNQNLPPEFHKIFNGHYDPVKNEGVVLFSGAEIKNYKTQYDKILLLRFHDKNNSPISIKDDTNVYIKSVSFPSLSLDNALPQQEYFYSQIQYNLPNNAYNVYKLQRSHYSERFYYIEIAECYGRINYAIKYDRYFSKEKQYVNETNIDIRYDNEEYGKRMIVVHTPDYVDAIYIIVFPREENFSFPDEDTIHFALKYWSFSYSEKADGSVLNVISKDSKLKGIVSKDIKYEKIDNDEYKFTWSPLELTDSTKVEYYIRVYSRNKFKNENESNSICVYNHALLSYKVTSNEIHINNLPKGTMYINLIAQYKTNEDTSTNIIAYNSLKISSSSNISIFSDNIFIITLTLIIAIFIVLLVLLYLYKIIRKLQVQHVYKLIDERKKNKGRHLIEKENEIKEKVPKNISCLIESDN